MKDSLTFVNSFYFRKQTSSKCSVLEKGSDETFDLVRFELERKRTAAAGPSLFDRC